MQIKEKVYNTCVCRCDPPSRPRASSQAKLRSCALQNSFTRWLPVSILVPLYSYNARKAYTSHTHARGQVPLLLRFKIEIAAAAENKPQKGIISPGVLVRPFAYIFFFFTRMASSRTLLCLLSSSSLSLYINLFFCHLLFFVYNFLFFFCSSRPMRSIYTIIISP